MHFYHLPSIHAMNLSTMLYYQLLDRPVAEPAELPPGLLTHCLPRSCTMPVRNNVNKTTPTRHQYEHEHLSGRRPARRRLQAPRSASWTGCAHYYCNVPLAPVPCECKTTISTPHKLYSKRNTNTFMADNKQEPGCKCQYRHRGLAAQLTNVMSPWLLRHAYAKQL